MGVPAGRDVRVSLTWHGVGATDRGRRRRRNEDALLLEPEMRLYGVADGMGGHAAGDVASRIAVESMAVSFARVSPRIGGGTLSRRLVDAFEVVNRSILDHATSHPQCSGMGTTLTCLAPLVSEPRCVVAHMGDSRAYLLRGDELAQVTRDHTWVQQQVDAGVLTAGDARRHRLASVLSRVLGTPEVGPPDTFVLDAERGDRWLLCSDGLSNMLPDDVIARLLIGHGAAEQAGAALIAAANEAGGMDNITVVVLDVNG